MVGLKGQHATQLCMLLMLLLQSWLPLLLLLALLSLLVLMFLLYASLYLYSNPDSFDGMVNLKSACNSECHCPEETVYSPLCGPDGITYFSPCHAGCQDIPTNNVRTSMMKV